jgi:hypothetical protein
MGSSAYKNLLKKDCETKKYKKLKLTPFTREFLSVKIINNFYYLFIQQFLHSLSFRLCFSTHLSDAKAGDILQLPVFKELCSIDFFIFLPFFFATIISHPPPYFFGTGSCPPSFHG